MLLYLVTNTKTGTQYIGKTTVTLQERWRQHLKDAKRGFPSYLYRAIRKYGVEAFKIAAFPIQPQDERSLNEWEKFFITSLRLVGKLYNMTDGGEGTCGWVPSEETRRKLRTAQLGKKMPPVSEEIRQRRRVVALGHPVTGETRDKISSSVSQLWDSPEYRQHMSDAHKGKPSSRKGKFKTHCVRGHVRTLDSFYVGGGCKRCQQIRNASHRRGTK